MDKEGNMIPHWHEANYGREVQHWIVYLWFVLEKYDLMGSSLQVLDEEVNATDGADNAPCNFDCNRQGNNDESSLALSASKNNDMSMFSKSIEDFGKKPL